MSWEDDNERTAIVRASQIKDGPGTAQACLVVLNGQKVGVVFKLDHEAVLGRADSADLSLPDEGISRQHCRLIFSDGQVMIEDLGSRNGTLVNGIRVERQSLQDGDRIQLGLVAVIKFTYHDTIDENFQRQMYEAAVRDGLTKAFNKRHFSSCISTEYAHAARHKVPLTLMMFDIDHFKKINDTHGHLAGDAVLAELGREISSRIRQDDIFARYGGEEFAILCRHLELGIATVLAERLRDTVEQHRFAYEGTVIPVTISIGLAGLPNSEIDSPTALIEAADKALYQAKHLGRNRVETKDPPP